MSRPSPSGARRYGPRTATGTAAPAWCGWHSKACRPPHSSRKGAGFVTLPARLTERHGARNAGSGSRPGPPGARRATAERPADNERIAAASARQRVPSGRLVLNPSSQARRRPRPDRRRFTIWMAAHAFWRSELLSLVKVHLSRASPADQEPAEPSTDVADHDCLTRSLRHPASRTSLSGQRRNTPDTPSGRASNERHGRHFSVKTSPITRTLKTTGQAPLATGSRIATHSTWWVIGNRSNARSVRTL